jgi:hypothetical protein
MNTAKSINKSVKQLFNITYAPLFFTKITELQENKVIIRKAIAGLTEPTDLLFSVPTC